MRSKDILNFLDFFLVFSKNNANTINCISDLSVIVVNFELQTNISWCGMAANGGE